MLVRAQAAKGPATPAVACTIVLVTLAACVGGVPPIQLGNQLLGQKKPKAALAVFREAITKEPNNGRLYLGLGRAYLALDDNAAAEKALARAAGLGEKPRAHLWLARLRREDGRYKEAAALLHNALSVAPQDWALHYELGMVQLAADDNSRAAQSFETTIGLLPSVVAAYVHLAEALANLNRHGDAAGILEDALAEVPNLPYALITAKLGVLYEELDRQHEADRAFKRALAKDPKTVEAIAGWARSLWRQRNHVKAIDLLRKAIATQPQAALLHLELGLAYDEFRVPDQAIASLMEAVTLDRRLERAYAPLLRLVEGNPQHSRLLLGVLAKAAKIFPDDPDIQLRFAREAFERKKDKTAIAAATRVIEIKPSHVEGNYLLGRAQARTGTKDAAIETYEALLILSPETAAKLEEEFKDLFGHADQDAPAADGAAAVAAGAGEGDKGGRATKRSKKKQKKKGKSKKKRKRRKR